MSVYNIIKRIYTWGPGTVKFVNDTTVVTTWGLGDYKWVGMHTMEVNWNGFNHVVLFDPSYTEYTSIRKNDLMSGLGTFCGVMMDIQDENGQIVDTLNLEVPEQELARKYIESGDSVFELGGRYGSVSCIINSKLACKTNHVVVEPDVRVQEALERNKLVNNCEFHIVKGFVSSKKHNLTEIDSYDGYGTTSVEDITSTIPSYTLSEIKQKYNLKFNVLVADCEGFLETFFDQNPEFYDDLRLVIFEADYPNKCNYEKIRNTLRDKGFVMHLEGHQNVWIKPTV